MTGAIFIKGKPRYSPHSELFGSPQRARRIRCVVVVAHPNDEIVGSGCLMSKISPLRVVHISDGAPIARADLVKAGFSTPAEYADSRSRECVKALELAGVSEERILEWRLPLFEASYNLVDLSKRLLQLFVELSPQVVLTHGYEGGHPDHDATAFAVHTATNSLRRNGVKPPVIYEMAIYPGNGLGKVPEFLFSSARESTTLMLDEPAARLKREMFRCFATQREVLADTPLGPEKFRQAPAYDFRLPPYFGKLHYELHGWGMTGKEWRLLAREALRSIHPRAMTVPLIYNQSSRLGSSDADLRG